MIQGPLRDHRMISKRFIQLDLLARQNAGILGKWNDRNPAREDEIPYFCVLTSPIRNEVD
jgi:hypothetical protein